MSDNDSQATADENEEQIPVNDKRKFSADGERKDDGEPTRGAPVPPMVAKLEDELLAERLRREAAEKKLVGVQAKFDELRAEMEKETAEMRQRMQRNNEQRMQLEKSEFISALLPVLDNISLAVQASEKESSVDNLLEGVRGVARLFEQTLISNGVEPIVSIGAEFDPELHEAVEMVEAEESQDWRVVGEFSRGYKLGDRLLRPAKVQVGRWLPPGTEQ